jgi:hypothetical protein
VPKQFTTDFTLFVLGALLLAPATLRAAETAAGPKGELAMVFVLDPQSILEAKQRRIALQIGPDGSQPKELARTKSWGYSTGNLGNLMNMAALASKVGVDLWNYETPDGRGIRRVIQFHAPFALGEKKWEYKNITRFEPQAMFTSLRRAAIAYKDPQYETWAETVAGARPTDRVNLMYPKPRF